MSKLRKMILVVLTVIVAFAIYMFLVDGEFIPTVIEPEETKLTAIKVTVEPTKVEYILGEKFDPTGMVVEAVYGDEEGSKVITDYTWSPTEAFDSKGDKKVTISYTEGGITKTVKINVKVINDIVNVVVKTEPTKLVYMQGEKFDPTGMVLEVSYTNGDKEDIIVKDGVATYPTTGLVPGNENVVINYAGYEVTQTIEFANGVFIEAEDGIINSSLAEIYDDALDSENNNLASGGLYVGNMRQGDTISFVFVADKAGTGDIEFRMASQYLKEMQVVGGVWCPILMGDCQFNKICEFSVNGVKYEIPDSAVLPGGGEAGGEPNHELWFNWQLVKFTNINFKEGRNDIVLKFIPHDYTDTDEDAGSYKGSFTANIDSLVVTSAECEVTPYELSIAYEVNVDPATVSIIDVDGVAHLVVSGTYTSVGYYEEEIPEALQAIIKFDLMTIGNGWKRNCKNAGVVTLGENNTYTYTVNISGLAVGTKVVTHYGTSEDKTVTTPVDFKLGEAGEAALNGKSYTIGGKTYTIISDADGKVNPEDVETSESVYWGCLGIAVSNS